MLKKAYVVGVGGGTCSGKSTLADRLEKKLSEKYTVSVINMDSYYRWMELKTIAPVTRLEYVDHNNPDGIKLDKLYADFTSAIGSCDIVIIEGLFALYFDQLRENCDLKIFVDLLSDERLHRRIKRHMSHGEGLDEVANRYLDTVRYRHNEFTEPTRWHADIVINGTLDMNLGTNIAASYIETQFS